MNNNLTMDDIKIGMYVTVLQGRMVNSHGSMQEDRTYKGRVLKVTAIDMPFLAFDMIMDGRNSVIKDTIDFREVVLKRLHNDFVLAVFPGMKMNFKEVDPDLELGESLCQEMGGNVLGEKSK